MSNAALELKDIHRSYRSGGSTLPVLNGLSLTLDSGSITALVGPSGSGKTTLLQIAGLLDAPDSGEVFLNGMLLNQRDDAMRTKARRESIGFIYQFHHLLPEFSGLENAMLPMLFAGVSRAESAERAAELLSHLGLGSRLHHRPAALSGGEQQRVAIARALANRPAVLLADEPTGNLDPSTSEDVFQLFLRTAREAGVATLVATHNMELAARADRMVRLENGKIS